MPQLKIPLIKGDEITDKIAFQDKLLVNMYPVLQPIMGDEGYLATYPGLTSFGIGFGYDRGGVFNERFNEHYRVSGEKLISIASDETITELGDIPGATQCRLFGCSSFNTQAIIADGNMYLYDPVGGFRQVVDPDLGSPLDCVWVDGYYFLTDGEYIYHTNISDEEAIDPLKYATAEFMPDASLGLAKTQDNKVVVFGRYSIEYFVNIATEHFAFKRLETRAQKIGIISSRAKCELDNNFYILGSKYNSSISAYKVSLGSSQKIATNTIDSFINQYTESELSDIRVEYRTDNFSSFIIYHLPNETFCYNVNIADTFGKDYAWSLLKTDVIGDNTYRGINGTFDPRINKWIYGDKRGSSLGYLNDENPSHFGIPVEWIMYSVLLPLETFSINELEMNIVPGFVSDDSSRVAFSVTFDGKSYSSEQWFQYSISHDYLTRFIIRQVGYVPQKIGFKFRGLGNSKMAFSSLKVAYS